MTRPEVEARVGDLSAQRVLVVEDDDLFRQLTVESLVHLGAEPTAVSSFADGLDALQSSTTFDIVVSDLVLHGEAVGVELLDLASSSGRDAVTVLISGLEVDARLLAGDHRFLAKPFGLTSLLETLSTTS